MPKEILRSIQSPLSDFFLAIRQSAHEGEMPHAANLDGIQVLCKCCQQT
jgi:hypothetical protein